MLKPLMVHKKSNNRIVLPTLAVFSIVLMIITVILAASVSNKFMKEQVAHQRNFLLVEPGIDDWTTCISLTAFSGQPSDKSLTYRASMVAFPISIDDAPCDELIRWIDSSSSSDLESDTYPRYWFGSSAIVRLLSSFTAGLDATRRLIFTTWVIVLSAYIALLAKRVGLTSTLLAVGPLFLTTDFSSAMKTPHTALSFSSALLFGIGLLLSPSRFVFRIVFLFGLWLPFFDPLTHPVLYFFIVVGPLIIESAWSVRGPTHQAKQFIQVGSFWATGYVVSWLAKWAFAAVFGGGISVFSDAFSQVLFRSTGNVDGTAPAVLDGVIANFQEYLSMPFASALVAVFTVYVVLSMAIRGARQKLNLLTERIYFLAVALSPVALFVVLNSHSVEHSWMTYRTLALSFGVALASMYNRDRDLFAEPST